ncbi:MAG TPA: PQQ-binding-like beta-propeller repeat protein [Acidimicrobiia bacterium]
MLASCDWTQPGFAPGKSYDNPSESTLTPGTVGSLHALRSISVPTGSNPAPIVLGDSVVVTSQAAGKRGRATVSSYSTATGARHWSTRVLAASAGVSAPVASGSTVVVGAVRADGRGRVVGVAVADGSIQWTSDLPATCTTACSSVTNQVQRAPSVTVVGQKVVVVQDTDNNNSCTGSYWRLSALDPASGAASWTEPVVEGANSSPLVAAAGSTVLLAYSLPAAGTKCDFADLFLHDDAYDPQTGSLTWSARLALGSGLPGSALFTAVGANGRYYGSYLTNQSEMGQGSFDADTGAFLGPSTADVLSAVTGSLALSGLGPSVVATQLSDGSVRWSTAFPSGSVGHLGPTVAGQVVYAVTDGGAAGFSLRTYDAGTGAALAAVPVVGSESRPVVSNGHVYLIEGTTLHVYGVA